jgi:hypothetical protein
MALSVSVSLSDWEVEEAYMRHAKGETMANLAFWYGVTDRLLRRAFRKYEERMGHGNGDLACRGSRAGA